MTAAFVVTSCLWFSSSASALSVGTVPNDGCFSYAGAIFCDDDLRSTGTGTFDPFLRTNGGGSEPVTSGWNTDAKANTWLRPNMADDSHSDSLPVSDVGTSTGGGATYWTFIVDINQEGGTDSLLDLTHLQLYSCPTNNYQDLTGCTSFYNLFGGAVSYGGSKGTTPIISDTSWITFDARNHNGSGSGDIIVFLPTSSFAFVPTGFVALLDGWGSPPGDYADNDGFQEWQVIKNFQCPSGCGGGISGAPVPEPATLGLLGGGLALASGVARRRKRR